MVVVLKLVLQHQCQKFEKAMQEDEYAIAWWRRFRAAKGIAQIRSVPPTPDECYWSNYYVLAYVENVLAYKARKFVNGNAATAAQLMGLCKMFKVIQKDMSVGLPLSGLKDFRVLTPSMTTEFHRIRMRNLDKVEKWQEDVAGLMWFS